MKEHVVPELYILHRFPPSVQLPYGGALVLLANALGKIKRIVRDESDHLSYGFTSWLTIEGRRLYSYHIDCPTCNQLLRAGHYPSHQHSEYLEKITKLDKARINSNSIEWLQDLAPFLNLFEPNFYFISLNPYSPTDGNGRFFWDAFSVMEHSRVLEQAALYNQVERPQFLLPTQAKSQFDRQRYENALACMDLYPGIAYHIIGTVSALLDGHHRATAAAKRQTTFDCITISPHVVVCSHGDEHRLFVPFLGELDIPEMASMIQGWRAEHPTSDREADTEKYETEDQSPPGHPGGALAAELDIRIGARQPDNIQ